MEWARPPGTLPDIHVLGSHQTHRQLGTVVHDCNPGYLEAEVGVQGVQDPQSETLPQNKTIPAFLF